MPNDNKTMQSANIAVTHVTVSLTVPRNSPHVVDARHDTEWVCRNGTSSSIQTHTSLSTSSNQTGKPVSDDNIDFLSGTSGDPTRSMAGQRADAQARCSTQQGDIYPNIHQGHTIHHYTSNGKENAQWYSLQADCKTDEGKIIPNAVDKKIFNINNRPSNYSVNENTFHSSNTYPIWGEQVMPKDFREAAAMLQKECKRAVSSPETISPPPATPAHKPQEPLSKLSR